ncbi:MAG: hypothetical protein V4633_06325 [Pseudomonadota bacterium]
MNKFICQECDAVTAGHDIVHFGSDGDTYRDLCTACFNTEMAARSGLHQFKNVRLEPVSFADCDGAMHEFHFRTRLLGDILSLEAFELIAGAPAGYQFQSVGQAEEELFGLLGRLIQKIRRTLCVKHIADEPGLRGHQIVDMIVRGRVEWDEAQDGRMPQVLVDGRSFTWEELGEMLMAFEGWQFKLEMFDPSDEV